MNREPWKRRSDPAFSLATYRSWGMMWQRCTNPKLNNYKNYGGKGIRVCERWKSFDAFLADLGVRPVGTSLDRIDNASNYEPGNCRWSSRLEQGRNSSRVKLNTEAVKVIRWMRRQRKPRWLAAALHGVHKETISQVNVGRAWR